MVRLRVLNGALKSACRSVGAKTHLNGPLDLHYRLASMVLKSGLNRLNSLKKWHEVALPINCFRLVGRAARLVSIVAVYERSCVFLNTLSHEKGHNFCLWG